MMEKIGMRPADLRRDGLQGHGLRALLKQQRSRGFQCGGAALFGVQAFAAY